MTTRVFLHVERRLFTLDRRIVVESLLLFVVSKRTEPGSWLMSKSELTFRKSFVTMYIEILFTVLRQLVPGK